MPDWDLKEAAGSGLVCEDPDFTTAVKSNRPPVAPTTTDPDRYTVYVPSEKTTLSLGQKSSKKAEHINDVGITGRTDNHIHLHVTTNNKTVVSLGGPATSVTNVPAHDGKVPSQSVGYSMVTDENAWQDAKKQHVVMSRDHDVVLRAKTKAAVLQSDVHLVQIASGKDAAVTAKKSVSIVANSGFATHDTTYNTAYPAPEKKTWSGDKIAKLGLNFLDVLATCNALQMACRKTKKKITEKKEGWQTEVSWDIAKILVDTGKLISTITREVDGWTNFSGSSKVGIASDGYVSLSGDISASMYGHLSSSVTSLVSASVLGGTASLKGILWTSVWAGREVSVKGMYNVGIEGERGKATFKGMEKVEISSEKGSVLAQGKTDVRLNSSEATATLHGVKSVYCAGGGDTSYGLLADDKGLHLGKFSAGKKFSSPGKVRDEGFSVDSKVLGARFKGSQFQIKDSNEIRLKTGKIKLNADSTVTVKGSKVLLG